MPAIEPALQALKDNLCDMLLLVKDQMAKCKKALQKNDLSWADKVIADEKKVNARELAIDRDCENILALYTPVATDLRLVLATLKITNDLERIGDNAKSVAKFLKNEANNISKDRLKAYHLESMLKILTDMLGDMYEAVRSENLRPAKTAAKKDKELNKYNRKAFNTTASLIKAHPHESHTLLRLFSLTRNLERAGDLTKNISEELVFQVEARIVKHKKDRPRD